MALPAEGIEAAEDWLESQLIPTQLTIVSMLEAGGLTMLRKWLCVEIV